MHTMIDTVQLVRPVPHWVRVWAILTATVALLLLFVLGGFVTSFRVGMADPVWPTEPWYLLGQDWQKLEFGFLVEHTHRAAGWIVGVLVSVLALGAWAGTPGRTLRWAGCIALLVLLVAYGEFHRGMGRVEEARKAGEAVGTIPLPKTVGLVTLAAAVVCLAVAALGVAAGGVGRWPRAMAVVALVGVMVQGLLGGFRVFLNELVGPELAAVHGAFGQVVFAVLVSVAVLAAPRRPGDCLPPAERSRLIGPSLVLPAAIFVQLVWAVWLRHFGSPAAQRLHVLTAFVVTGLAVALVARTLSTPDGRKHLGFAAYHLLGIIAVQMLLGVEAWMSKFAAGGGYAGLPPDLRPITEWSAGVRTAHAVIGAALLAAAVAFAVRVGRRPVGADGNVASSTVV